MIASLSSVVKFGCLNLAKGPLSSIGIDAMARAEYETGHAKQAYIFAKQASICRALEQDLDSVARTSRAIFGNSPGTNCRHLIY